MSKKGKKWYQDERMRGVAIMAISALGLLLSLYFWQTHQSGAPTICTTGCDSVIHGDYGVFLGVPMGAMGAAFYLAIGLFAYLRLEIGHLLLDQLYKLMLISGVVFTIYLRYVEFVFLGELCALCWISVLFVLALTALELVARRK